MKANSMKFSVKKLLPCIPIVFYLYGNTTFAEQMPRVNTSVEKDICSIKVDNELIDSYKCEYSRAPSILSYSYLYEAGKKILVFIDSPLGNACDGGPLHVFSKTEDETYKPLKIIDFCGGHYPSITSGPENFMINIPSISIDGTDKKIPAEIWELKNNDLVKRKASVKLIIN